MIFPTSEKIPKKQKIQSSDTHPILSSCAVWKRDLLPISFPESSAHGMSSFKTNFFFFNVNWVYCIKILLIVNERRCLFRNVQYKLVHCKYIKSLKSFKNSRETVSFMRMKTKLRNIHLIWRTFIVYVVYSVKRIFWKRSMTFLLLFFAQREVRMVDTCSLLIYNNKTTAKTLSLYSLHGIQNMHIVCVHKQECETKEQAKLY